MLGDSFARSDGGLRALAANGSTFPPMSFIPPPSQTDFEAAKARSEYVTEKALHFAETHPKADHSLGTRPQRLLRRVREALRRKRVSQD